MKHLEIEQIKKYGRRELNVEEMTQAVLHLDECRECFDSFQKLFPALTDSEREISTGDITADETEVFHLDYDEHLRPFVDYEADEVTREIVESHLANCSFCARAVRELREFSDSWRLRETGKDAKEAIEESEISGATIVSPHHSSSGNIWRLSLSLMIVLILSVGGWLLWHKSQKNDLIAEIQIAESAPRVLTNENSSRRLPKDLNAKLEIKQPVLETENGSANNDKVFVNNKNRQSNRNQAGLLPVELPPDFRARFQNAMQTQKVELPAFINDLRGKSNLRGEADNKKPVIISPDAQAERSVRPIFRWRRFARQGESYIVTIFDDKFNQIAVSPNLSGAKWQSNISLQRGKIYSWQVKTGTSADLYTSQFKVLDDSELINLKKIEDVAPQSPLVRGIGYASAGLIDEAEREFQKEIVNNPYGSLAKRLKNSIRKHH